MGPRPDGRGRSLAAQPTPLRLRVNGAAAGWPRKVGRRCQCTPIAWASMGPRPDGRGRCARRTAPCAGRSRVNGAAAGWPRKEVIGHVAGGRGHLRQWGRGRMAAEGGTRGTRILACPEASMGPRPDGRGRPAPRPQLGERGRASMGPRPDGRGRRRPGQPGIGSVTRQWGRGRMAAEGRSAEMPASAICARQWGRGRMAAEGRLDTLPSG